MPANDTIKAGQLFRDMDGYLCQRGIGSEDDMYRILSESGWRSLSKVREPVTPVTIRTASEDAAHDAAVRAATLERAAKRHDTRAQIAQAIRQQAADDARREVCAAVDRLPVPPGTNTNEDTYDAACLALESALAAIVALIGKSVEVPHE